MNKVVLAAAAVLTMASFSVWAESHTVATGESFTLTGSGDPPRTTDSLLVTGGTVTIGANTTGAFWLGGNGSSFELQDGLVTANVNGVEQSGSRSGLLLGYTGSGLARAIVSGGRLFVENSSLNFWLCSELIVRGDGIVRTKGVFKGSGAGKITLSEEATFEIGSLGWKDIALDFHSGCLSAYESSTIAAPITLFGNDDNEEFEVRVAADSTLSITGVLFGRGTLHKTGEGVLSLGSNRPPMDVYAGSVRLTATAAEIAQGKLVLPVSPGASRGDPSKVTIVDVDGNEFKVIGSPVVDNEALTCTITLETLPVVTESTGVGALELSPALTGVLIVQGPAERRDAIDFTFDRELPANVSVLVSGCVNLKIDNDLVTSLPLAKISIDRNAVVGIDSDVTMTVAEGTTIVARGGTHEIVNNGTFETDGETVTVTLTNNDDATFSVLSGTTDLTAKAVQSVKGTINVAAGATLVNHSGDAIAYSGNTSTIINVRGTLEMAKDVNNNWSRWTIGGLSKLNLYGGSHVSGTTTGNGALDLLHAGEIITVHPGEGDNAAITAVVIDAKIRLRNNTTDNPSAINIANNMTLEVTGGFSYGDGTAIAKRTGGGHLTGRLPLNGSKITFDYGEKVANIPARFVVESGTGTLKWTGSGAVQIANTDSLAEPFITINSGAGLNIYGHDYSGWNGGLTQYGWIVNNGTLTFQNDGGSRFFRDHLVLGDGATVRIEAGSRKLLLYGGVGTAASAQLMLPSGTASIEVANAEATENAAIHLGNDGPGGYGDNNAEKKGAGVSVGEGARLTIAVPVTGADRLVKHGIGTLVFAASLADYRGALTLEQGRIEIPASCGFTGEVVPAAGRLVRYETREDGTRIYHATIKGLAIMLK